MDLVIAAVIMFVAAAVQGGMGFGFGLISMALLPLLYGVAVAVPVVSVFSLPLSLSLAWRLRADLSWARLGPMLLGGLLGVPIGVTFLRSADPTILTGTLGALLVAFAAWLGRANAVTPRRRWLGGLAGFAGGVLGGAFATGGPPVIAYTSSTPWSPEEIRATLQAHFGILSILHIVLLVLAGLTSAQTLTLNVTLLPALLLGGILGDALSRRLSPARFRVLIRLGMAIVGVAMLQQSLSG
ncbi:MAG: sulfite exporter TauE/SafE family protein [Myxococcota bacterium]|nr:sulfite exporter TauE/SafE family protein [Myxococcota bacterium]